MKPVAPVLALGTSVGLLVLSFVLLSVFGFDTPMNPRADVPPACTETVGFRAAQRLLRWQRLAAYLLLLHGFFLSGKSSSTVRHRHESSVASFGGN